MIVLESSEEEESGISDLVAGVLGRFGSDSMDAGADLGERSMKLEIWREMADMSGNVWEKCVSEDKLGYTPSLRETRKDSVDC